MYKGLTGRCVWIMFCCCCGCCCCCSCCCGRISLAACCCCCCCCCCCWIIAIDVWLTSVTGGGPRVWGCICGIRFWGMGWVGSWTSRADCCCWSMICCCCCCMGVTRARREGTLIPLGRLDWGTGSRFWRLGGKIVFGPRFGSPPGWTIDRGTELICDGSCCCSCWCCWGCWGRGVRFEGGPGSCVKEGVCGIFGTGAETCKAGVGGAYTGVGGTWKAKKIILVVLWNN